MAPERARRLRSALILGGVFLGIGVLGLVRYLARVELALSVFFLVPISISTWYVGRRAGILASLSSAGVWLGAELAHGQGATWVPLLNETFRCSVFLAVAVFLDTLRAALRREQQLSMTDFLTGLGNRRAFFDHAGRELERARRYGRPFALVYLDLDNFKAINDRFGHQTGDELLCRVADTLRVNVRSADLAVRFGGDEFVLLLPEAGAEATYILVPRLNQRLLEVMAEHDWPVTFSIGELTVEKAPADLDALIREADRLMYAAKQDGGNRIHREVMR